MYVVFIKMMKIVMMTKMQLGNARKYFFYFFIVLKIKNIFFLGMEIALNKCKETIKMY
jgi:hypothetical protein